MNGQLIRIAILVLVISVAGCKDERADTSMDNNSPKTHGTGIKEIANSYQDLNLMTPEPVFVNPELAMLCVGASKAMVERARIDKGAHANCSVRIFMNKLGSTAFKEKTNYPVGSIIVKEKEMLGFRTKTDSEPNGTGNGVGGMVKRDSGYDETNGNWEYFYFESVDKIESGKMHSCIEGHRKASKSDFVFAHWEKSKDDKSYGY